MQIVKKIPHEGEVLKCRANLDGTLIASILTSGAVNLYDVQAGAKQGSLQGLTEESFCLDWNKKRSGLLASAAGSTVCVWDVAQNIDQESQLLKIAVAHDSADQPVNDVKFSPFDENRLITSGNDGFYKM